MLLDHCRLSTGATAGEVTPKEFIVALVCKPWPWDVAVSVGHLSCLQHRPLHLGPEQWLLSNCWWQVMVERHFLLVRTCKEPMFKFKGADYSGVMCLEKGILAAKAPAGHHNGCQSAAAQVKVLSAGNLVRCLQHGFASAPYSLLLVLTAGHRQGREPGALHCAQRERLGCSAEVQVPTYGSVLSTVVALRLAAQH